MKVAGGGTVVELGIDDERHHAPHEVHGTDCEIQGLAFRDHGWGKRFWEDFVAHRWVAGTLGPDLTVLAVSVLGTDDSIAEFGCVIRDGELTYADTVDIVTNLESDELTHRGSR